VLKRYALIGILVMTGALAMSAFSQIRYQPVSRTESNLIEAGFRTPHFWNGIYIPSMAETGYLVVPLKTYLPDMAVYGFRSPHMWNGVYIPSTAETTILASPIVQQYPYKALFSDIPLTKSPAPVKWNSGH
jgi:hypothetical protein